MVRNVAMSGLGLLVMAMLFVGASCSPSSGASGDKEDDSRSGIRGRVVDGDGQPVSGVPVELLALGADTAMEDAATLSLTTGEDGTFFFHEPPPGGTWFFVRLSGEERATVLTHEMKWPRRVINLRDLPWVKAANVTGRVLDPEGEPIEGAYAVAMRRIGDVDKRVVQSDADGSYLVDNLLPGTYQVGASALRPGYRNDPEAFPFRDSVMHAIELAEGEQRQLELHLRRAPEVEVRVLDVDGEPVAEASVDVETVRYRYIHGRAKIPQATTDAEGVARLSGLPDLELRLEVMHPRMLPAQVSLHLDEAARQPHSLTVTLHRAATVTGRITEPDGTPVSGQRIRLRAAHEGGASLEHEPTNADGRFTFHQVPPAPLMLYLGAQRHGPFLVVAGETHDIGTLIVQPYANLEVVVTGPDGKPLAASLRARPVGERGLQDRIAAPVGRARTDTDGKASMRVRAGTYALMVDPEDRDVQRLERLITVSKDTPNREHVQLQAAGRVHIKLQNEPGRLGQRLIAQDGERHSWNHGLGDGRYKYFQVPPGQYRLSVGTELLPDPIRVEAGKTVERTVTLDTDSLTLTLLDESGEPLPNTHVELTGWRLRSFRGGSTTSPRLAASTNAEGAVRFAAQFRDQKVMARLRGEDAQHHRFLLGKLSAGDNAYTLRVPQPGGATLDGRISHVEGEGAAVAGAQVHVWRAETDGTAWVERELLARPDGGFRLSGLLPGRYLVSVRAPGMASELVEVEVVADAVNEFALTMHKAGHLAFELSRENPAPRSQIHATAMIPGDPSSKRTRSVTAEMLIFANLRAGATYEVRFESDGHETRTATFTAATDSLDVVPLRLSAR